MESNYSPGLSRVSKQYLLPFQYFWDGFGGLNRREMRGKIPIFAFFSKIDCQNLKLCEEWNITTLWY